ncbi:hypothetical protein FA13DRAFT_1713890 [Coprinellus micaceus]|uniref:Uncharacterized protein n=1 Tax=Coprinellus micaceus TaxID=71717 RepID=A0A4Y7SUW0_COPMI|nr:hypothetical protein FA13DRAFT_1713890 [Coprinellus micaceus]
MAFRQPWAPIICDASGAGPDLTTPANGTKYVNGFQRTSKAQSWAVVDGLLEANSVTGPAAHEKVVKHGQVKVFVCLRLEDTPVAPVGAALVNEDEFFTNCALAEDLAQLQSSKATPGALVCQTEKESLVRRAPVDRLRPEKTRLQSPTADTTPFKPMWATGRNSLCITTTRRFREEGFNTTRQVRKGGFNAAQRGWEEWVRGDQLKRGTAAPRVGLESPRLGKGDEDCTGAAKGNEFVGGH